MLKGASGTATRFADDKRASYSPVHKVGLALSYENRRTPASEWTPSTWASASPTRPTPTDWTLRAAERRGAAALNEHLSLTLAGKNLLNQVYQSVNGYLMPPLSFWVGAELTL